MELIPILPNANKQLVGAILIKSDLAKPTAIITGYEKYFSDPDFLESFGVMPLYYGSNGKVGVKVALEYAKDMLALLAAKGIMFLYVADATYFKVLTGEKKSDPWRGYVLPCAIEGFEEFKIVLGYNFNVLFYNPTYEPHLITSCQTLEKAASGLQMDMVSFEYNKTNITKSTNFNLSTSSKSFNHWIDFLLKQPKLSLDIEGLSLKHWLCGIATFSVAWSDKDALNVAVDMQNSSSRGNYIQRDETAFFFLTTLLYEYKGIWAFHNGSFDLKVLIFEVFMKRDHFNYEDMLYGIELLTSRLEDTKLLRYLATNNANSNRLSLKEAAHEYVGNYAQDDIKNVLLIPLDTLLNYNGTDAVATMWCYNKYYPMVVADDQLSVYETILKPSIKLFLQAELVGIPLDMDRVLEAIEICEQDKLKAVQRIMSNQYMKDYAEVCAVEAFDNQHLKWKKKRETIEYFRSQFEFNPNSDDQAGKFLFDFLGFEPIELTPTGKPSVAKDALAPLKFQTDDPELLDILQGFEELGEVAIILSNFLTTFRDESVLKDDGNYWLHGSHNIGGTKSGRLSSSDPKIWAS